ncbi:MAG: DNA-binding protein WhiA [Ruminococcaceae bacterium]|nr:DNA-binding protein WhiA [Oscillospiraceae bacterium]
MASFSSQVKNELVKIEYDKRCCKKSLLYGMALFSKCFSYDRMTFQSENENIIMLCKRLLKELCNIDCNITVSPSGKIFTIDIKNKTTAARLFNYFAHSQYETSLKINFSNFNCQDCQNAFLAGVFLSCGTVTSPEKDYHLEFSVAFLNLTKSLMTLFAESDLSPKLITRKGYHIIYFKDSESIEDCLYIMGASASMFDMMNIKIVKEIRNAANRKANCETANIEKTVNAASPQIAAILKIQKKKGLESLSPQLHEMAEVRLDNPDLSLSELASMFNPPISRSGANHRLKRLIQIADEL